MRITWRRFRLRDLMNEARENWENVSKEGYDRSAIGTPGITGPGGLSTWVLNPG